jgi:hypothetical protein
MDKVTPEQVAEWFNTTKDAHVALEFVKGLTVGGILLMEGCLTGLWVVQNKDLDTEAESLLRRAKHAKSRMPSNN